MTKNNNNIFYIIIIILVLVIIGLVIWKLTNTGTTTEKLFPKVSIKQSTLANAGLGLFADEDIDEGIVLPYEYRGDRLTEKECEQLTDTSYVWEITTDNDKVICIDAKPHHKDNFIRYVNGAGNPKQCKQVNLEMIQKNDRVYYKTTKRVMKGEELIVNYGDEYFEVANGKYFSC